MTETDTRALAYAPLGLQQNAKALAPIDANRALGLPSPEEMAALKDFCRDMVGTPFLPRTLVQNRTTEQQAGTLLAVILTGKEMGLLPMFSLRAFWLSPDGRLGMYADAMLGVMRSKGVKFKWLQNTNQGVQVEADRDGETYTAEFTTGDAQNAGLLQKAVWKAYPKDMCRARCVGQIFRALCSDMGGTQMYTREELIDMEPETDEKGDTRYVQADRAAEADPALSIKPKVVEAEIVQKSTSRPVESQAAPAETATPQADAAPPKAETITPKAEPKPPDPFAAAKDEYKATLAAIRKLVPGLKKNHPTDWLSGWFRDSGITNPSTTDYAEAIKILHDVLEGFPTAKDEFLTGALAMGIKMRQRMAESDEVPADIENEAAEPPADESDPIPGVPNSAIADAFGWSAQTCTIASKIIRDRAKVNGDEKAVVNALMGFGFKGMNDDDAVAMLTLYAYDTDAFLLRRKAEAKKIPPSKLLVMVEEALKKPITDFPPGSPEPVTAMNYIMASL
jgi:hypothetical protein